MTTPKTTFAGKSPFQQAPKERFQASDMEICNDLPPEEKRSVGGKYDRLFDNLKPGQGVKCPGPATNSLSQAARKWLVHRGKADSHFVRAMTRFPGDTSKLCGRVWILPKAEQ